MLVLMACGAGGREAQPGATQILGRELRPRRGGNMLRAVTGAAAHAQMLAVQYISGLCVVESRWRWIPVHHLEVLAVVVGVALDARRARRSRAREGGGKPPGSHQR